MGWGKERAEEQEERKTNQPIMKAIKDFDIVDNDDCQTLYKDLTFLGQARWELPTTSICALSKTRQDTTKGDGGGPLVCLDPYEEEET